ncbi:MAG: transcription-repair coupling factor [Gemmatales bacterium]|nr:transcription-repair coupling factor [Gemmatales bacterium]MDW8387734.1 transcription-repair coupling factor [Gemmatales bacterium]
MTAKTRNSGLSALAELPDVLAEQPGLADVLAALRAGHAAAVDGAWGSSASLTAALISRHVPTTLLVVLAHLADVDAWCEDLLAFANLRPVVFPAWERSSDRLLADEVFGQRLRVLKALHSAQPPRMVVAPVAALMQPTPTAEALARHTRTLRPGETLDPEDLVRWLVEGGMTRREAVELPGEFSRRGGIVDIFPSDADMPVRLEFFGDQLESLRWFDPATQRSRDPCQQLDLTLFPEPAEAAKAVEGNGAALAQTATAPFTRHLPEGSWIALIEPDDLHEQGRAYLERASDWRGLYGVEAVFQHLVARPNVTITTMPVSTVETTAHLRVESVERFSGTLDKVREELESVAASEILFLACPSEGEQQRLKEVFASSELAASGRLHIVPGKVRAGFRLVEPGILVLSSQELFHRQALHVRRPAPRRYESRAIDSFLDLNEGDLVVHVGHGIARYRGMTMLESKGHAEEHLILEFADHVLLYVPSSKIDLVQKYVGGPRAEPELSKLGGTAWQKRKQRVEEAVADLAAEMLEIQAIRASRPGTAFPPDTEWQAEFEASFPYEETPDQLTTLQEIKADMESLRPMDRLICGDVGFGKTELAVRAAFKAVDFGKQVAVLVPTTVLAEQHYRTFTARLAEYPFTVECLSRLRSTAEQRDILRRLADGKIDIIIGTHRLLSADVQFKDLGLVIIDEEQRFGVEHKERLKKMRATVDVLTLTATPIPRTLHLALMGIRDISNLETPPRDRLAIETRIIRFDPELIRHAILRELNREGQVFFVHNRVFDIHQVAERLHEIVPQARIVIGHGQMPGEQLEQTMLDFINRKADILVATTIIESGLDIPNVNTIFIDDADQYGLADLHQLRGRVGRYRHRAYCYLIVNPSRNLTPAAVKRLKAIEEFTELGAGFRIAMRDLEIRGAGNILGTQQSGHIAAVGYELYCQLLENAVRRVRNEPVRERLEVEIDLPWRAYLPRDYVPGQKLKIELYRRLSRIRRLERLEDFRQELTDRFGPPPTPVEWLLRSQELRILCGRWQIAGIRLETHSDKADLVFTYRSLPKIERLSQLSNKRLRVVDDRSAYCRLRPEERSAEGIYRLIKSLLQSSADSL